MWLNSIGVASITIALVLELGSYWKQISKTLRTKRSSQVSSSAFLLKLIKYVFTLIGLAIYVNWVAFGMEVAALVMCSIALYIVCKFKPKGWKLWR